MSYPSDMFIRNLDGREEDPPTMACDGRMLERCGTDIVGEGGEGWDPAEFQGGVEGFLEEEELEVQGTTEDHEWAGRVRGWGWLLEFVSMELGRGRWGTYGSLRWVAIVVGISRRRGVTFVVWCSSEASVGWSIGWIVMLLLPSWRRVTVPRSSVIRLSSLVPSRSMVVACRIPRRRLQRPRSDGYGRFWTYVDVRGSEEERSWACRREEGRGWPGGWLKTGWTGGYDLLL